MSKPIVCHVVAGYPTAEDCLKLMRGMSEAGVAGIEVQIPFSDPIADGETIMHANDVALSGGMTTAGSFELIQKARQQGVDRDIYIMSYIQKVQHFGLEAFCERAAKAGVKGLIIPDLPYESPEYSQLAKLAGKYEIELIPVLSPGMSDARLKASLEAKPSRVYATSQRGITGNAYSGTTELKQLTASIKSQSKALVMVGFGIATPADVDDALKIGGAAVVGSAVIKRLQAGALEDTLAYIRTLAEEEQ